MSIKCDVGAGVLGAGEFRLRDDGQKEGRGNGGMLVCPQIPEQAGGGGGRASAAHQGREIGKHTYVKRRKNDTIDRPPIAADP